MPVASHRSGYGVQLNDLTDIIINETALPVVENDGLGGSDGPVLVALYGSDSTGISMSYVTDILRHHQDCVRYAC